MLPHLSSLLMVKWGALRTAAGQLAKTELPGMTAPDMLAAMLGQGAHVAGHAALAGGSILVGMAWGAAAAFVIDRAWIRAAIVLAGCGLLSLVGVIHAPGLGLYPSALVWTYAGVAVGLAAIGLLPARLRPAAREPDQPS